MQKIPGGNIMKTLPLAIITLAIVLASCSSSKYAASSDYDDVYYDPNVAQEPTAVVAGNYAITPQTVMYTQPIAQEPVDSVPSEVAQSGYRVGAPRAQGPDPYSRFDGDAETPSNVRHFPTRDREPADDLKLSSLLGPSSSDAETGQVQVSRSNANAKAKSTEKTTPKNPSKATGKRRGSAKSSDDSE
jgi:hypothetical protein